MIITSDIDTGSVYIKLRDTEILSQMTLGENVIFDMDSIGNVVGIEIIEYVPNPPKQNCKNLVYMI